MASPAPNPPPGSSRLFLALWPDRDSRDELAAWTSRWQWPRGAAVVPADRLHLTLHFIGPVPDERLPELRAGLSVPTATMTLDFGLVERWAHGLVVCSPLQVPEEVTALHRRLAVALRALGLPVESRPFRPHLTLARRATRAVAPAEPPKLRWVSQGYSLVRSERGYHDVARFAPPGRQSPSFR